MISQNKMVKPIPNLINQMILTKLGHNISERLGVDYYPLIQAMDMLIAEYGEENLYKNYPNYSKVKKKIQRMNSVVIKTKGYYDAIEDKKLKRKFKDLDSFDRYLQKQFTLMSSRIPLIQLDVWKLFVFLSRQFSIQSQTIRSDMMKIYEYRDNTKIDLTKDKKQGIK